MVEHYDHDADEPSNPAELIPPRIRASLQALVHAAQLSGMTRGELLLVCMFLVLGMMAWEDDDQIQAGTVWPLIREIFGCNPEVDGDRRDQLVRMLIPICLGETDTSVH